MLCRIAALNIVEVLYQISWVDDSSDVCTMLRKSKSLLHKVVKIRGKQSFPERNGLGKGHFKRTEKLLLDHLQRVWSVYHVQSSQQSTEWWMMLILNPIRISCLAWPTTPKLGYHLIWILVLPRAQSRPWKTRIVTLDTINTSTRHRLATESLLPCQRQAERIANRIITVSVYSCILDFTNHVVIVLVIISIVQLSSRIWSFWLWSMRRTKIYFVASAQLLWMTSVPALCSSQRNLFAG